jgi:hypothetical protein
MLGAALAQLRFASALLMGRAVPSWALSSLIAATIATREEFGELGAGATEQWAMEMADATGAVSG